MGTSAAALPTLHPAPRMHACGAMLTAHPAFPPAFCTPELAPTSSESAGPQVGTGEGALLAPDARLMQRMAGASLVRFCSVVGLAAPSLPLMSHSGLPCSAWGHLTQALCSRGAAISPTAGPRSSHTACPLAGHASPKEIAGLMEKTSFPLSPCQQ